METDPACPLPTDVTLYPAAPNPFNSTTTIRYSLPRSSDVQLTVYDSAGRLVEALSDGWAEAGNHRAVLHGGELAAGVLPAAFRGKFCGSFAEGCAVEIAYASAHVD